MNKSKEEALRLFKTNHNCCQAVIGALHDDLNMDKSTALHVSAAFGGGIGRQGRTCGAVVGAYMALGMKNGMNTNMKNDELKSKTHAMAQKFNEMFEKAFDSTICSDLLGVNIKFEEGRKQALDKGLFDSHCPKFVGKAIEITHTLWNE